MIATESEQLQGLQQLSTAQGRPQPECEVRHLMAQQAKKMAPYRLADLALPPEERELIAFMTINDAAREPDEYLPAESEVTMAHRLTAQYAPFCDADKGDTP